VQLTGAIVLVTGASGGIGRATAVALAGAGAHVVCAGRDAAATAEAAAAVGGTALTADLRSPDAPGELVERTVTEHGRLDAVVVNAGVGHAGPVAEMSPERIAELVDVNVRGSFLLARAAAAAMTGPGAIVFVSSIAGAVGVPGESVYSATKAALEAFAPLLGEELRARRVTVSTVLPGVVDTEFFARRGAPYDRRFPRPIRPERVADVVVRTLRDGRPRRIEPRWLEIPARLSAAAPRTYRALARRFG
jgi:NAD(P)-dependent dehydrogenase (short-subunit alcohol dehydrogenase family)